MEYDILQASTALFLVEKVAEAIKDGWVPQGGVTVSRVYSQAMVKALTIQSVRVA